jgi:hypothetical protein
MNRVAGYLRRGMWIFCHGKLLCYPSQTNPRNGRSLRSANGAKKDDLTEALARDGSSSSGFCFRA